MLDYNQHIEFANRVWFQPTTGLRKMENRWEEYPLEKVMSAIIDCRGKSPDKTLSGVPLVTAKIIKDGRIEDYGESIAEEEYESWMRRGLPEVGDVLITTEALLKCV